MKALFSLGAAFAALIGTNAFAASSYKVTVDPSAKDQVAIRYTTTKTYSSMCHLKTNRLDVKLGERRLGQPELPGREGAITIESHVDPLAPCLTAFGPHRGGLQLKRGYGLPNLEDGSYRLTINGESYGTLVVNKSGVRLVD